MENLFASPKRWSIQYRKCRSIFYIAIIKKKIKFCQSKQYLRHRWWRVSHVIQLEIFTTFYGSYIKIFFPDTSVCSICNARTKPKEMNTGDRYPAAYWWTPAEFAEPCRDSLRAMNLPIHGGSHFPRWREIFPARRGKQTVLPEPRRKYDSRDVS